MAFPTSMEENQDNQTYYFTHDLRHGVTFTVNSNRPRWRRRWWWCSWNIGIPLLESRHSSLVSRGVISSEVSLSFLAGLPVPEWRVTTALRRRTVRETYEPSELLAPSLPISGHFLSPFPKTLEGKRKYRTDARFHRTPSRRQCPSAVTPTRQGHKLTT